MQIKNFIGIDVSKKTLDITILDSQGKQIYYEKIGNDNKSIKSRFTAIMRSFGIIFTEVVFCLEYTGIYNLPVLNWLQNQTANIWLESGSQIKKSQGLARGKNDKTDSGRIAFYAFSNRHAIKIWRAPREVISKIAILLSQRNRLLKAKKQLIVPLEEQKIFLKSDCIKALKKHNSALVKALVLSIAAIEKEILEIIKADENLFKIYKIATSVDGVGMVTAAYMITTTNEFLSINEAKKYACYSGVAPFEHSSGSSIRGKTRVSHMANKKVKTILHMAALAAIQTKGDIMEFYNKKIKEGKNKMSVLNAVRNKIIHRVFACVRQNRMFQKNYTISLPNP